MTSLGAPADRRKLPQQRPPLMHPSGAVPALGRPVSVVVSGIASLVAFFGDRVGMHANLFLSLSLCHFFLPHTFTRRLCLSLSYLLSVALSLHLSLPHTHTHTLPLSVALYLLCSLSLSLDFHSHPRPNTGLGILKKAMPARDRPHHSRVLEDVAKTQCALQGRCLQRSIPHPHTGLKTMHRFLLYGVAGARVQLQDRV